jgi:hypothetical protein
MLLWSNLRYYPGVYLEGLKKVTKTSYRIVSPYYVGQDREHTLSVWRRVRILPPSSLRDVKGDKKGT